MTTIDDKINLFSKIIFDKVNEEKDEKLGEFNKEAQKKLEEENAKISELKKNIQRDILKKANTKANEIVAREKLNKQREILALKEALIEATLDEVKDKLLQYVSSKQYDDFFMDSLEKALREVEAGSYYLVLVERDYQRFKEDIQALKGKFNNKTIEIRISEEDFIGGVILLDAKGTFKVDNSLFAKLQESKELIGVKVMEMLYIN